MTVQFENSRDYAKAKKSDADESFYNSKRIKIKFYKISMSIQKAGCCSTLSTRPPTLTKN